MSQFIWLALVMACGWLAGKAVGGKGLGVIADILLGITGSSTVRFFLDAVHLPLQRADVLWLSIAGSAALPILLRLLISQHDKRVSVRGSHNLRLLKAQVIPFRSTIQARKTSAKGDNPDK
jgi:uncharacterized membrane protein YeaQ/YmgE (transglycosylase-associated protein family)